MRKSWTSRIFFPSILSIILTLSSHATGQTYKLRVVNGSGGGDYAAGTTIPITADVLPEKTFDKWIKTSGNPAIADVNSPRTNLVMPAQDADVTASYKPVTYQVTVLDGNGDGFYEADRSVTMTPYASWRDGDGKSYFKEWLLKRPNLWEVVSTNPAYTFTMPRRDVVYRAVYTKYLLTVVGGTGTGFYEPGTIVSILAPEKLSDDEWFDEWQISTGDPVIGNAKSAGTTCRIREEYTKIKATYVKVFGPTPSPSKYPSASLPPSVGQTALPSKAPTKAPSATMAPSPSPSLPKPTFTPSPISPFKAPSQSPSALQLPSSSPNRPSFTVVPSPSSSISPSGTSAPSVANYRLRIINGSGEGDYVAGETITIVAEVNPEREFDEWRIDFGNPTIVDFDSPVTSLTMPPRNVDLIAIYAEPLAAPSITPSDEPTLLPSTTPLTNNPSVSPTFLPSVSPTLPPSITPSDKPSLLPSMSPSSNNPSVSPTFLPSVWPTLPPSITPSDKPSLSPSMTPLTNNPSVSPIFLPSVWPTLPPSITPSDKPSLLPSTTPSSNNPSVSPTSPSLDKKTTAMPSTFPSKIHEKTIMTTKQKKIETKTKKTVFQKNKRSKANIKKKQSKTKIKRSNKNKKQTKSKHAKQRGRS